MTETQTRKIKFIPCKFTGSTAQTLCGTALNKKEENVQNTWNMSSCRKNILSVLRLYLHMKVYKITEHEWNKFGCYSDQNSVGLLDMISLLKKEKVDLEKLLPVKIELNISENKGRRPADLLFTNIGNIWMISEKARSLLEQKYGEFLCLFPLDIVDEADHNYCAMLPTKYIEGLDVERSVLKFDSPDTQEGIYDLLGLDNKYVFKDSVRSYPLFRLKKTGFHKKRNEPITHFYAKPIFVLDEFVRFISDSGLTGFNFEEVYDSGSDIIYEEFSSVPPAPVTQNIQTVKKTRYEGKFKIPFKHENGIYKLCSIEIPEGDGFIFELDDNCILFKSNDYTVYGTRDCNVPRCTEITYQAGKLFSIYINTPKGRLPVYLVFDFTQSSEPETLTAAINECIELCCNDFIKALDKAVKTLRSAVVEYYYDSEQMSINLQDENSRIYNVGTVTDHMLRCICICAGEQYSEHNRMSYETFEKILNGLYKRLSEEIPKRFELTDDFRLHGPEMYD